MSQITTGNTHTGYHTQYTTGTATIANPNRHNGYVAVIEVPETSTREEENEVRRQAIRSLTTQIMEMVADNIKIEMQRRHSHHDPYGQRRTYRATLNMYPQDSEPTYRPRRTPRVPPTGNGGFPLL